MAKREDIASYVIERDEALRALDIEWARKRDNNNLTVKQLLAGMHKARILATAIEPEYKASSREWLIRNGYSGDFF